MALFIGWKTLIEDLLADSRSEWWRRTQWALDATASDDAATHQLVAQAGAQEPLTREQSASVRSFSGIDDRTVPPTDEGLISPPIPSASDLAQKDQVFYTLRREILAARLKITLDEQLNRDTSPAVKHLAQMKLPPIIGPSPQVEHAEAHGPKPEQWNEML